ncbi:MAG TPA: ABC transporter substrate-binding protein [Solirubrobacterales bacterium]|nr:ABC transporter substrate-binding protein [Solirubrobacterales bacterium]
MGIAVAIAAICLCLSAALASAGQTEQPEGPTVLRATFSSFPDYMDPQLSYTQEGWTAMYDTYIPLLTYRHAEGKAGSEVIPGLAKSLPKITDGGRTYTLFLRRGLKYSNGTPVHASDFEYAVRRLFKVNSGGAPFYTGIVGAERFWLTRRGGIGGIVTDNNTGKIVIHLARPRGTFTQELALMFVAPVPPSTPMHDASFHPPPATGPYVIDASREDGWTLKRNPVWESTNSKLMPQLPSGHVDRIEVDVLYNRNKQVNGVEEGRFDWMEDPPPTDRLSEIERRHRKQFRLDSTLSTYYFWMNTQKPPFDDLKVRRAVNYAVDASRLRKIYEGQVTPTHQILPPDMPGYRRFNLYPHNLTKARRMIRQANPRDRRITVWTDNESPNAEAGIYYAGVLRKLGFHVRLKVVSADFYFTVIGNASTPNLDTGWSDWFEDYPHPDDFFQPLLAGSSILRRNNSNFAQIDTPSLNSKIASLAGSPLTPAREGRYAALDRAYMKLAPWVPYGTRTLSTFVSERVDLGKVIYNPTFGADLTSFQFK